MKIEKILALKQELAMRQKEHQLKQLPPQGGGSGTHSHKSIPMLFPQSAGKPMPEIPTTNQLASLLTKLLEPVPEMGGGVPYELTEEYLKRKGKRPKISH